MPYKPSCGQRNIKGVGVEITNLSDNSSSQFGEWPHVCAIVSHPGNQVSISQFVSKSCTIQNYNIFFTKRSSFLVQLMDAKSVD
jgi:hypothetical protein